MGGGGHEISNTNDLKSSPYDEKKNIEYWDFEEIIVLIFGLNL